jgi:hypothetical protein
MRPRLLFAAKSLNDEGLVLVVSSPSSETIGHVNVPIA